MEESLYILQVIEDGELLEYEYGNLKHCREHYQNEENATIFQYKNGEYHYLEGKIKETITDKYNNG